MSENAVPQEQNTRFDFSGANITGFIKTINGDGTVNQILAAGPGISIVPGPAGTNTINNIGILSVNADGTSAQLLAGFPVPGMSESIHVADDGIGGHTFDPKGLFASIATPIGVPVSVPDSVPTIALTLSVPGPGLWYFTANINKAGPTAPTSQSTCRILNGASAIGECVHTFGGGVAAGDGHSVTSYLLALAGGENIDLEITQTNSAVGPYDYNAVLEGIRIGS